MFTPGARRAWCSACSTRPTRSTARVDAGIARLPLACRPGINAARLLYAEIGHEVARRGLRFGRVARGRAAPSRKARLLAARWVALFPAPATHGAPLAATRFLVEAVAEHPLSTRPDNTATSPQRGGIGRAVWVVALFEQLELREQGLQREPT